ncbi:MAG: hypothetical protein JO115_12935 [Pseudonocardiales bacterium]|nr:hypothetical protein [Pseudonocardiales bacterium]
MPVNPQQDLRHELDKIGAVDRLDIVALRPDRSLRPYTTNCVVRVDDTLYVHSHRRRSGACAARRTASDDPTFIQPADTIIRLSATCVCDSDLWDYRSINSVTQVFGSSHFTCTNTTDSHGLDPNLRSFGQHGGVRVVPR